MLTDVRCVKCGKIHTDKILFGDEKTYCDCGSECEKINDYSAKFRLKYTNSKDICSWGAEGYSKSRYYEATDKQCKRNIFPMPTKRMV